MCVMPQGIVTAVSLLDANASSPMGVWTFLLDLRH